MRFFASVTTHVNDQHILSLERFFVPRTSLPATHKRLLVAVNMISVDVTDELILRKEFEATTSPMAVCFEEYASIIFRVCGVSLNCFTARATVVVVTHLKIIVFVKRNFFVHAAEAAFFDSAAEMIGISMVQVRTRG